MSEPASRAVFLSYASQDAEAARRIADALRGFGVEVWFDQNELSGGDAWDQKIRRQIKECVLFVPVISAHTNARPEGYFRLEWKLAVDRSHLMADDAPFLLPVVVDSTADTAARVPDKFREVQWTQLPGGEVPGAFVERVRGLLGSTVTLAPRTPKAPKPSVAAPSPTTVGQTTTASPSDGGRRRVLAFVAVFAVLAIVVWSSWWLVQRPKSPAPAVGAFQTPTLSPGTRAVQAKSLAVLPFQNLSSDKESEYLSDGITDELIIALQTVSGLQVKGRASSFYFKGRNESPQRMGEQLQVSYLLDGSVSKAGNTLRVTASLVNAADGFQVWGKNYNQEMRDILAIRQDVAQQVVNALRVQLGIAEARALSKVPTENGEVYRLYLLGMRSLLISSEEEIPNALRYFSRAIELEPGYARGHAGVALSYLYAGSFVGLWAPIAAGPKCRTAAQRAIDLDPMLADGYVARAYARMNFDSDWSGAEVDFKRALELNPNSPLALDGYANFFALRGRFSEGLALVQRALEMDPLSAGFVHDLGWIFRLSGRYDMAIPRLQQALNLDANLHYSRILLGDCLIRAGETEQGLLELKTVVQRQPDWPAGLSMLGYAYGITGRREEALKILGKLNQLAAVRYVPNSAKATVYIGLERTDDALDSLEKACAERDADMIFLKVEPLYTPVLHEPRYQALLKTVGLAQ